MPPLRGDAASGALRRVMRAGWGRSFWSLDRCRANYFLSKGSITTDEIFKLVKSIILGKGFNADGSDN
jgi:hypothetical protein